MVSTPSSSPWRIPDSSWLTPADRAHRHRAVRPRGGRRRPSGPALSSYTSTCSQPRGATSASASRRERPQRDRPERADRVPLGAQLVDDVVDERRRCCRTTRRGARRRRRWRHVARLACRDLRRTSRPRCASARFGPGPGRVVLALAPGPDHLGAAGAAACCRRAPTACRAPAPARAAGRPRPSSG